MLIEGFFFELWASKEDTSFCEREEKDVKSERQREE